MISIWQDDALDIKGDAIAGDYNCKKTFGKDENTKLTDRPIIAIKAGVPELLWQKKSKGINDEFSGLVCY